MDLKAEMNNPNFNILKQAATGDASEQGLLKLVQPLNDALETRAAMLKDFRNQVQLHEQVAIVHSLSRCRQTAVTRLEGCSGESARHVQIVLRQGRSEGNQRVVQQDDTEAFIVWKVTVNAKLGFASKS